MPRIKLEGLAPLESLAVLGQGIKTGGAVLKGAAAAATTGATAVNTGLNTGITGVFSLGKGFRDFILRGTVVELAVAVVLGTAFTNLVASATADFITPLIGAIFQGSNFQELSFEINSSRFRYGDFINAFLTFVFVVTVLYFCVVVPLEKLQYAAFKHKAIMRDCPYCLEEISMAATRCKHCTAEVPLDEGMQHTLELATAALDAEEQRRQERWYRRMFAPCAKCCCKPKQALVQQAADGEAQLQPVCHESSSPVLVSPLRQSMSGVMQRGPSLGGQASSTSTFVSPQASFTASGSGCTVINMEQLMPQQQKDR